MIRIILKGTFGLLAFLAFLIFLLLIFFDPDEVEGQLNQSGYFFDREPYVSPRMVEDLMGLVSDSGEQIVSLDIANSVNSNRYFGEFEINGDHVTYFHDSESCSGSGSGSGSGCQYGSPFFSYEFVGTTTSGVHVLLTSMSGGGSGIFNSLLLLTTVSEKTLDVHFDSESRNILRPKRERWLLKRLWSMPLGDRYIGGAEVSGNEIRVFKDENPRSVGLVERDIVIEIDGLTNVLNDVD